jgi:hypothetical protein
MGGIRIGGRAFASVLSPPFSLNEGAIGAGVDQNNVWIVENGVGLRLTPYVDPTCSSPPCAGEAWTPRMNPAKTLVAFFDFDPDDFATSLWVIPVDGSATYPLSPTYRIWDDAVGFWANHAAWAAAGDKLLFVTDEDGIGTLGGKIVEVTYPGAVATTLWTPDNPDPGDFEAAYRPTYSPDGTKIAFFVNQDGGGGGDITRQGLWTMDADGSNDQLIDGFAIAAANGGYLFSGTQLAWSNDSEWIAYIDRGFSGAAGGTASVYKIRPDGTDKTLLKEGVGDGFSCRVGWGAWLDDDSKVICTATDSGDSGWRIFALEPDGSGETELIAAGSGPAGTQNEETCYRLDSRIYWIRQRNDVLIHSCALDGSDVETVFDGSSMDAQVGDGSGFEWV